MWQKAMLFNDYEIARQILKETDVRKIKALGRKVKDFDNELWDKHKEDFMFNACYAKFSQNAELRDFCWVQVIVKLLKQVLLIVFGVLVSPPIKQWRILINGGQNLLGKILMKVREVLK